MLIVNTLNIKVGKRRRQGSRCF